MTTPTDAEIIQHLMGDATGSHARAWLQALAATSRDDARATAWRFIRLVEGQDNVTACVEVVRFLAESHGAPAFLAEFERAWPGLSHQSRWNIAHAAHGAPGFADDAFVWAFDQPDNDVRTRNLIWTGLVRRARTKAERDRAAALMPRIGWYELPEQKAQQHAFRERWLRSRAEEDAKEAGAG